MSDKNKTFEFYFKNAQKYLIRWNANYFNWLMQYFGDPDEYGDNLKIAWRIGNRKAIYYPKNLMIQLHENLDGKDLRWKMVGCTEYPSEEKIKGCAAWLKGEAIIRAI